MDKTTMRKVHKALTEAVGDGKEINIFNQRKRTPIPQSIMVFQAFSYLAATKLKPATNQVLMLFFSKTIYGNFIGMDVKSISEELSLTERSIISSLNQLVQNNIIIRVQNLADKRRNDYFINPMAAWKGNGYERKINIKKMDKENPNQLNIFGMHDEDPIHQALKNPQK